jgi:hypothetical protein
LGAGFGFEKISLMRHHLRNHHHGIWVMAPNGNDVRLLTIGYLSAALRRSRWTILQWEKLGLLPPPAFVMNPRRHRAKRRLYPHDYIEELGRVTANHYPAARLERESRAALQRDVYDAYNRLVMPLLGGVTPPVEIEMLGRVAWDRTPEGTPSTTTCA